MIRPASSPSSSSQNPVGLDFKEPMSGTAVIDGKRVPVSFKLQAHIPDIDGYTTDPKRTALLSGTVKVGDREVPVSGTLNLMEQGDASQGNPGHYLEYRLETPAGVEPPVRFAGTKQVKDDPGFDLPADLTTLRGNFLPPGVPMDGKAEAKHPSVEMKFEWKNPLVMARFLASFHAVQGGHDAPWRTPEAIAKFAKVYGGGILSEFAPFVSKGLGWLAE